MYSNKTPESSPIPSPLREADLLSSIKECIIIESLWFYLPCISGPGCIVQRLCEYLVRYLKITGEKKIDNRDDC